MSFTKNLNKLLLIGAILVEINIDGNCSSTSIESQIISPISHSMETIIRQNFLHLKTGVTYQIPQSYGQSFVIEVSPNKVTIFHKKLRDISSPLNISPIPEDNMVQSRKELSEGPIMDTKSKYAKYYLYRGKIQSAIDLAKLIMSSNSKDQFATQDEEVLYYTKSILTLCKANSEKLDVVDNKFFGTELYYSADPYTSSLSNILKPRTLDKYKLLITEDGAKDFYLLLSFRKFASDMGLESPELDSIAESFRMLLSNIGNTCDDGLVDIFSELKELL